MATQTLTTADAILKNVYRGTIVELLNQECFIMDMIEKQDANNLGKFDGRQLVIAIHTGRNRGRGVAGDGGGLANAGTQSYMNAFVPIHYFNEGIELTDLVIKQTQTDEGAFVKALSSEMSLATTDMRKDACRMAYGTGDGLLATLTTSPGSTTTFTVDNGQYIGVGDTVDLLVKTTGATTTNGSAATVSSMSFNGTADTSTQANASIVLAAAVTADTTYGLYISGDRANESDGLVNITNTGRTLHQVNSSTYPIWDGNVLDAANTFPNEDLFMQLAQRIQNRTGKRVKQFVTTLGVQRRLANTYTSQKRYNDARATEIDGGYTEITVSAGGQPAGVVGDTFARNGYAFAMPQDETFAWAELTKPDWLLAPDGKGSILHLKDGSTAGSKVATWQAWLTWPAGLACVAPNRDRADQEPERRPTRTVCVIASLTDAGSSPAVADIAHGLSGDVELASEDNVDAVSSRRCPNLSDHLGRELLTLSSPLVLHIRHGFEMVRIDAAANAAEMV